MTRLCPPLSFADAARVQEILLEETLAKARQGTAGGGAGLVICHDPDDEEGYFAGRDARLMAQGEGDLGERMYRCLSAVITSGRTPAILVGTDIPELTPQILTGALGALRTHDAVLGPTKDGGYYLIGFNSPPPRDIFRDLGWSRPDVAEQTRKRLRASGLRWAEAPRLADIDRFEDLVELADNAGSLLTSERAAELVEVLKAYP